MLKNKVFRTMKTYKNLWRSSWITKMKSCLSYHTILFRNQKSSRMRKSSNGMRQRSNRVRQRYYHLKENQNKPVDDCLIVDQNEFINYNLIPVLNSFKQSELWRNLSHQLNKKLKLIHRLNFIMDLSYW